MEITSEQQAKRSPLRPIEKAASVVDSIYTTFASEAELRLVDALKRGDEAAFMALVEQFHVTMIRIARRYVSNSDIAEEVVQETWLGVLHGLDHFEQRSSLKTWIFRILLNRAKSRASREARWLTFSEMHPFQTEEPAVEADAFDADGWWRTHPADWSNRLEHGVLWQETYAYIQDVIQRLPVNQRLVITLRDIEGWTSLEVCAVVAITEENQRVLLHRARAKVRKALARYWEQQAGLAQNDE